MKEHRWGAAALGLLVLSLAAPLDGCSRGPVCAENGCPGETVCELDGTCRPLASLEGRFRDARLPAADFGGTRSDMRSSAAGEMDVLLLGGEPGGAVYLAFDLPSGHVAQAVLVLHPAEGATGAEPQTIRVSRVREFEGAELTHRSRPLVSSVGPGRHLTSVADRAIRVDVTELVDPDEPRLFLAATADGEGAPWRIASPVARDPDRAPHLEVRITRQ